MPLYVITVRGGLLGRGGLKPEGSTIELSAKDASSLPPGSVELVVAPPASVTPPPAPAASAPAVTPPPAVEAPKGRKGK